MWWSRALLLIAVLALGPAGCGFRPLYGTADGGDASPAAAELAAVRIGAIQDRLGQMLRNSLVERITPAGEPASPKYELKVILSRTERGLAQQRDGLATLGDLELVARYFLTSGEQTVYSGSSRTRVSYEYTGPRYGTVAMERDAEERAVTQLAEEMTSRLGLVLTGRIEQPRKRYLP